METKIITNGTRQVIATRNDEASKWNARLYISNGETATQIATKLKTLSGLEKWSAKVLA